MQSTRARNGILVETVAAPPLVINVDKDGKPVGGVQHLTVKAGGSVTFKVPATIEGVFEAEMESRGEQILELTVNP